MYDKCKLWAESFLRCNFFGFMQSTGCESMNAYLNQLVQCELKLVEFVSQIDRSVSQIRNIDAKEIAILFAHGSFLKQLVYHVAIRLQ